MYDPLLPSLLDSLPGAKVSEIGPMGKMLERAKQSNSQIGTQVGEGLRGRETHANYSSVQTMGAKDFCRASLTSHMTTTSMTASS